MISQKNKKICFSYIKITILLIIVLLTVSFPVRAKTTTDPYGRNYKVKVGDTVEYNYTFIDIHGNNYASATLTLQSGNSITVNYTVGTNIYVKITTINLTNGNNVIDTQGKIIIPGKGTYTTDITPDYFYVRPAFDNKSMVDLYIADSIANFTALQLNSTKLYEKNSNIITNSTFSIQNQTYTENFAWDWKTGWITYYEFKVVYLNGTILSDTIFKSIGSSVYNQNTNYLLYLTLFGSTIFILVLGNEILDYRKKRIKKAETMEPFDNKKPNEEKEFTKEQLTVKSIDKSLKKLEEIINESEQKLEK